MTYLLDTHVLIWFLTDNTKQLSATTITIFNTGTIDLCFSVASIWELSIKHSLGKPNFDYDPKQISDELLKLGFIELPIALNHVCAIRDLPRIHGDPFDRLLMVQAKLENLILLTADNTVLKYNQAYVQDVRL